MVDFVGVFGDFNRVKVVQFFLEHFEVAYTCMALGRLIGISRKPLRVICLDLVRLGVLKPVDKKFSLRFFSPAVKSLRDCLAVLKNE